MKKPAEAGFFIQIKSRIISTHVILAEARTYIPHAVPERWRGMGARLREHKKTGQRPVFRSVGRSRSILLGWSFSSGRSSARSSVSSRRGSRSSARSSSSSVSSWSGCGCVSSWGSWSNNSSRSRVNDWCWGNGGFFFFAACGQSNSHQGDDQQGFFHGFSLINSRVRTALLR
jgi:hypothetical protein